MVSTRNNYTCILLFVLIRTSCHDMKLTNKVMSIKLIHLYRLIYKISYIVIIKLIIYM